MNKKYIVLLLILCLLLTGCNNKEETVNNNNTVEKENTLETTDNTTSEDNIPKELLEEQKRLEDLGAYDNAFEEFNKIYPEGSTFEIIEDGELRITIDNLVSTKGFDASILKKAGCDLEKSFFVIYQDEDGNYISGLNLICTK